MGIGRINRRLLKADIAANAEGTLGATPEGVREQAAAQASALAAQQQAAAAQAATRTGGLPTGGQQLRAVQGLGAGLAEGAAKTRATVDAQARDFQTARVDAFRDRLTAETDKKKARQGATIRAVGKTASDVGKAAGLL